MCENCFPMCFFEGGNLKIPVALKCEKCEHRDDTSIVDGDQENVKCYFFCVERPSEEVAFLGCGIELYGSSSCVRGLRSLLKGR